MFVCVCVYVCISDGHSQANETHKQMQNVKTSNSSNETLNSNEMNS